MVPALDTPSDRIVPYLGERFGVPIDAIFFRQFQDDGDDYLERTYLVPPEGTEGGQER